MNNKKLPIGYYLKKVDNLLTEGINKIHSELELTRTDWQILNTINNRNDITRDEIISILSEFADIEILHNSISNLIQIDLLFENGILKLTDKGKNIHQICLEKQTSFRKRSMRNISEQEYMQIINTLKKIIDNLEQN